jgi:uncharacterized membrane protein YoaK (UPF0700 family)
MAVIGVGLVFLLRNLGVDVPWLDRANWWAWFLLIGALAPLTRALEAYRARGRGDAEVISALLAGAAVATVATMFLLGLDWSIWWPLFVILGGAFTLVRGDRGYRDADPPRS